MPAASETTNPAHLEYMGLLNELIREVYEDQEMGDKQRRLMGILGELRYSWNQMINSLRIFMATRAAGDLRNVKLFSELNAKLLTELEAMEVEIGFGGVEQLRDIRSRYMQYLPEVIKVFQSDAWRMDAYLMKTEVRPVVEALHQILETLVTDQVSASRADGRVLADGLEQTRFYAGLILLTGLATGMLAAIVVVRGTAPITKLTRFVANVSLDKPNGIDNRLLSRNDEVGGLARAFHDMLSRLSDSHRLVRAAKRELEYQKDAMDKHAIVSIADVGGRITYVNDKFCEISQYDRKALLGQDHHIINSGHHPKAFFKELWATIGHGKVWHGEVKNRKKDGSFYWMNSTIVPFMDEPGKPYQYVSIRTDITQRKQTEQALQQLNDELEDRVARRTAELLKTQRELEADIAKRKRLEQVLQTEKQQQKTLIEKLKETQDQLLQSEKMASIGQLAAGVAHEINNPVGYIYSNIGTLRRYVADLFRVLEAYEQAETGLTDPQALQAIQTLKQEVDLNYLKDDIQALVEESQEGVTRVKQIVQDLKDFSHVDEAEWQWADLHKGLDSTLNIVNNELKYKAEVVRDYAELPPIECIASQLNQVFMNLLVNAAHAIEDHGAITVRTGAQDADWVWVAIADTGRGIPPDNLKHIFDPFFTTKPVGTGTGLGLSLSYGIVQKHGGHIEVDSEPGRGTTFTIRLPVQQTEARAEVVA